MSLTAGGNSPNCGDTGFIGERFLGFFVNANKLNKLEVLNIFTIGETMKLSNNFSLKEMTEVKQQQEEVLIMISEEEQASTTTMRTILTKSEGHFGKQLQ